jgi:hypothetical protein
MTDVLMLILVIQAGLMLAGLFFLVKTRSVITPRSVWWSFTLRDLLWLALITDQIAGIYQSDRLPATATILISFLITSLLLFNIVMRYRAHHEKMLLNDLLRHKIAVLEMLRDNDELGMGYSWDHIPPIKLRVRTRV